MSRIGEIAGDGIEASPEDQATIVSPLNRASVDGRGSDRPSITEGTARAVDVRDERCGRTL